MVAIACFALFVVPLLLAFSVPSNPGDDFAFDSTGTLSAATRKTIRQVNSQLASTGAQIVVCMIPSLGGDSLEEAALDVFRSWGIGDRNRNNGVLLLIAKEDRRLRIEVGYGLEGPIPDSVADRIIRQVIAPEFRNEDYDAGVLKGFNAIVTLVAEEYDLTIDAEGYAPVDAGSESGLESVLEYVVWAVFIIFFLVSFFGRFFKFGPGGRTGSSRWTGGGWSGGGGGSSGGGFGGGSSGGGGASGGW